MRLIWLILGIILFLFIFNLALFIDKDEPLKSISSFINQTIGNPFNDNGSDLKKEGSTADYDSSGTDSSSGGSSDSSAGLYQCSNKQISYSLTGPSEEETCLEEDGLGECIKKQMNCSLEIKNLDYEIFGEFIFDFTYSLDGEEINHESISKNLGPRESYIFSSILILEGLEANKSPLCLHNINKIPKKTVC